MSANIEKSITTNTSTFINTTVGQGASLSFSGAGAGSFTIKKALNDGTLMDVTDDTGAAVVITVMPTTINLWVGSGTDLHVTSSGISGTLVVTSNPLKSDK